MQPHAVLGVASGIGTKDDRVTCADGPAGGTRLEEVGVRECIVTREIGDLPSSGRVHRDGVPVVGVVRLANKNRLNVDVHAARRFWSCHLGERVLEVRLTHRPDTRKSAQVSGTRLNGCGVWPALPPEGIEQTHCGQYYVRWSTCRRPNTRLSRAESHSPLASCTRKRYRSTESRIAFARSPTQSYGTISTRCNDRLSSRSRRLRSSLNSAAVPMTMMIRGS